MKWRRGPRTLRTVLALKTGRRPPLGDIPELALTVLADALAALEDAQTVHWVTYGTLLGLVRDGQLLPHDNDIDIAVLEGADHQRIRDRMLARGFIQTSEQHDERGPTKQKFLRDAVMVDLFFLRRDPSLWLDRCAVWQASELVGGHLPVEVRMQVLGGVRVPAPADVELHLAHLYGPRWRTPVRYWHWVFSPPNAELHMDWRDVPWFLLQRRKYRRRKARSARAGS